MSMLELQIVSDLHVEFWACKQKFNFMKPVAPILALLGDICCCGSDDDFELFKRFIKEVVEQYEHVIFVAGNHEYYYNPPKKGDKPQFENTVEGIDEKIKAFFKETSDKLHYLNNSSMTLTSGKNTYLIVGSTLWSWIPEDQRTAVQSTMNDYNYIYTADEKKNVTPLKSDYVANKHLKNYKFIKTNFNKAKKLGYKLIVLTHHKPYQSEAFNPASLDVAYESDMTSLFEPPLALWAYGHTHVADNSMQKKAWLYSNPKGYPKQKTKYNRAAMIKV